MFASCAGKKEKPHVDTETKAFVNTNPKTYSKSTKTLFLVILVAGSLFALLGGLALVSQMLPHAGSLTSFFNHIGGALSSLAMKLGTDSMSLAILGASVGGTMTLAGLVGYAIESCKQKKEDPLAKQEFERLQKLEEEKKLDAKKNASGLKPESEIEESESEEESSSETDSSENPPPVKSDSSSPKKPVPPPKPSSPKPDESSVGSTTNSTAVTDPNVAKT